DDEDAELTELMDFGLQQPRGVPSDAIFYFTPEGEKQHRRLLQLLKKASLGGVVRRQVPVDGDVVWQSGDGQIAVVPRKAESPKLAEPDTPETEGAERPTRGTDEDVRPQMESPADVTETAAF